MHLFKQLYESSFNKLLKQMQPKSKGELLIERLEKIKQNSNALIRKMDNKINTIQEIKDDLNDKS